MAEFHIPMLPVQREFFNATEPFVAIVSSRSCGKSWIAMFSALTDMLLGRNVIYMSQTDGAFYRGPWLHLQTFLREFNLQDRWSWNGTYKIGKLKLGNGIESKMYFGSYSDEGTSARGATECSTLYLDEFCLSKPNILAVMTPCCRGKDNYGHPITPRIRAVSTPNMASLWQIMIVEHEKYGIRLLRSKMTDNVFMTDEQRQVMASTIFDDKLRRQEIDGEIILGSDDTAIIQLNEFPIEVPYCNDDRVYAGLDMAKNGQRDSHVFAAIKGNRLLALHEFGICDSLDVGQYIREFNNAFRIHHLSMDLAWSEAIFENIKYEVPSTQVSFAEKAPDEESQREYANIRAYGYFKLAKLHRQGLCVDLESPWIDQGIIAEYKREIVNTHFIFDRMGRLLIEPKDDIKIRLGRSPDVADALMLAGLDRNLYVPKINSEKVRDKKKLREWASMMG